MGIAVVMDTNASAFRSLLGGLLQLLQKVFLPHFVAALGMWLLTLFVILRYILSPLSAYPNLKMAIGVGSAVGLGFLIFVYAFVTAGVCAVRIGSASWEDFLEAQFDRVREVLGQKVADMDESLSKDQARLLVSGSVRDVFSPLKRTGQHSFIGWLGALVLGLMTLATRSVLLSKMLKVSGRTVQLSKLFAGRATLVGAIVLNLHFFAVLLLALLYLVGLAVLLADFLMVFWLQ